MSDFIINLPYHKRWWLPDRRHQYNSVLFGDQFHLSIIDSQTGNITDEHSIGIGNPDYLIKSQELAYKKYRR